MKNHNKNLKTILSIVLASIPLQVHAASETCSTYCRDVAPAVRIVKYGLVPLFQIIIPIALIVMGMIDFGKAVVASREEEMKKAQSMFIKRCLYAVAVFFVITIVTLSFGLFSTTGADNEVKGTEEWWQCYNSVDSCKESETEKKSSINEVLEKSKKNREETNVQKDISINNNSSSKNNQKYNKTIYVGDSRTVGMCASAKRTGDEDCEIAEVGQGLSWLISTATPKLESKLSSNDNVNVVIMMGVNNIPASNSVADVAVVGYNAQYTALINKYPNTNFIIVSITQVDEEKEKKYNYHVTNSNIIKFNTSLKSKLPAKAKYCDVYSKIDGKYNTTDGLHYDTATYQLIYDSIQTCL